MKRADIKVGDELYYDSGQDWALPKYGESPGGSRAVVVDLGPYRINRQTWGFRAPTYQADPKGTAVLVDVYREGRPSRKEAVPVAHLRGPYVKVLGEVSAALADRAEVRDGEKRRRELARDRAYAAETRAARLGFVAHHQSNEEIWISTEEFERILDRLDGGS